MVKRSRHSKRPNQRNEGLLRRTRRKTNVFYSLFRLRASPFTLVVKRNSSFLYMK